MIFRFKNKNNLERAINFIIILSLFIAFPISIWEGNWINLFSCFLTVLFLIVIQFIEGKYDFKIPGELRFLLLFFIYLGIFLGGFKNLYVRFWWFDYFLHLTSGFGLGLLGFLIPYSLQKTKKIEINPFFIAVFGFCFAISLGVLWEIFEFSMDHFFNMNMQSYKNLEMNLELADGYFNARLGLIDTMKDLMLDTIGAFSVSLIGYLYLKNGEFYIFDKFIKKIEVLNPNYFK
jgi:hypothetical protein